MEKGRSVVVKRLLGAREIVKGVLKQTSLEEMLWI